MNQTALNSFEIHQLTKAQYNAAKSAGELNENALYLTPNEVQIEIVVGTISSDASYWNGNNYQKLNTDYAHELYDIDIDLDGSASDSEELAWCEAAFKSSGTSNILTAKGTKPTIDIPIIITLIKK